MKGLLTKRKKRTLSLGEHSYWSKLALCDLSALLPHVITGGTLPAQWRQVRQQFIIYALPQIPQGLH